MGSQAPLGTKPLWNTEGVGLPGYVREIARSLMEAGKSKSQAIQLAIGIVRRWARGGGNVTEETRAKAAKAVAEFEAARAKAKATPNKGVAASHTLALGNGPSCPCGGPHDLVFYANRSTPQVVDAGKPAEPKKGYGKVTRRRRANAAEEKQIKSGQWIRVDQSGNTPSDDDYKKTRYRPQLTASQEAPVPDTLALSVEQVAAYLALAKHRAAQRYRHGWIPIVPEAKRGGPGKHAKADDTPSKPAAKTRTKKPAAPATKVTTGEKTGSAADHATRISAADGLRGARAYLAKLSTPDLKAVDVEMRRRRELLGSKAKNPRHQAVKDEIAKRLKRKTTSTSKPSVKAAHGWDTTVTDFDIDAARLALSNLQNQLDELALAMPPQLAKAQKAGKTGAKKAPKTSSTTSATVNPDAAKSDVQVPAGQEDAFKKLVAQIMKRPGMDQEKAEKVAAALLRNRKPAKSNA